MAASEWEKLRRTATRYKEMYPPGTRVVLNHMEDPWSPVPAGTRGTVAAVDAIGQIHMKWDNGRHGRRTRTRSLHGYFHRM